MKLKNIILVILLIVIIGAGFVFLYKKQPLTKIENVTPAIVNEENKKSVALTTTETEFITYNSSEYGIEVSQPSNWTIGKPAMGVGVAFFAPRKDSADMFQENITITFQNLPNQEMTLSQYTDLSIKQILGLMKNINIIESKETNLNGNPAYKVVFTGTFMQRNLKWSQIWTIKDNQACIITYTNLENDYLLFLDIFNRMVGSFRFI